MPAIQPARLKKQVSDLAAKFDQPEQFVRELHALLHHYTDHTHRAGQTGEPSPLMDSYNTPAPVMRQVWLALAPLIKSKPQALLPLCDALWVEPNYDFKLMSARLLGQVSIDSPELVLERVHAWVQQGLDKRILDGLLQFGLMRLKKEAPKQVVALATSWLEASDLTYQQAGLRALLPVIDGAGHEYLPAIFRLLTPYLRIAPSLLRPDILAVLSALVHSSPSETAYLLRQNLAAPDNPDTAWLIRKVLDGFPPESQQGLKQAMKAPL